MSTYAMRSKSDRRRIDEEINHRMDKIETMIRLVNQLKALKSLQSKTIKAAVDYTLNSIEDRALAKANELLCLEIDVIESELTYMTEEMADN